MTPRPALAGRRAAAVGAAALAAFAALAWAAVRTPVGQRLDEHLFGIVITMARGLHPVAAMLRDAMPVAAAVVVAALTVRAGVQRRWADIAAAALQGGAALAVSRLVRDVLLTRPDLGIVVGYAHNTLPSTHATLTAGLCAAALILVRPRLELRTGELVAAGTVTVLAGLGSVASWAHRPADVVASTLLVIGLAALAVGARDEVASARQRGRAERWSH